MTTAAPISVSARPRAGWTPRRCRRCGGSLHWRRANAYLSEMVCLQCCRRAAEWRGRPADGGIYTPSD